MSRTLDDPHAGAFMISLPPSIYAYALTQPHQLIWVRDLDDLSVSLEWPRGSIPEVLGNDAPQAEQRRWLVDLVSFTALTTCRSRV